MFPPLLGIPLVLLHDSDTTSLRRLGRVASSLHPGMETLADEMAQLVGGYVECCHDVKSVERWAEVLRDAWCDNEDGVLQAVDPDGRWWLRVFEHCDVDGIGMERRSQECVGGRWKVARTAESSGEGDHGQSEGGDYFEGEGGRRYTMCIMSSGSAVQTPAAPVSGSTQPKRPLNWESLVELTEQMKLSISDVQTACQDLPLPEKVCNHAFLCLHFTTPTVIDDSLESQQELPRRTDLGDSVTSLPISPLRDTPHAPRPSLVPDSALQSIIGLGWKLENSNPSVLDSNGPDENKLLGSGNAEFLATSVPIENTQQFLSWFANIEAEMEKGQDDVYRSHLATLNLYLSTCNDILSNLAHTTTILNQLSSNYISVQSKTQALQQACERLLEEQTELSEVEREIRDRLRYFDDLEVISRQLSMSGDIFSSPVFGYSRPRPSLAQQQLKRIESTPESPSVEVARNSGSPNVPSASVEGGAPGFLAMLERLDECLAFMESHPNYLDADLYRLRFRQCLTRSMSLIKLQFVSEIQQLSIGDGPRASLLSDKKPSPTIRNGSETGPSQDVQVFLKFRAAAVRLTPLLKELERRAPSNREYLSLLRECYSAYFSARAMLVNPRLQSAIMEMEISGGVKKVLPPPTPSGLDSGPKPTMPVVVGDIVGMARTGFAYVSHVCSEEYSLFLQFFSVGSVELRTFLDSVTAPICDSLRALIIVETRIDHLSDLCLLLSSIASSSPSELILGSKPATESDEGVGEDEDEDEDDESGRGAVKEAALRMLEDAQARLTFRAQEFIRKEIEGYEPREAELEVFVKARKLNNPHPMVLLPSVRSSFSAPKAELPGNSTKGAPATITVEEDHIEQEIKEARNAAEAEAEALEHSGRRDSMSISKRGSSAGFTSLGGKMMVYGGGDWYPTVQRTIYILGRLYRSLQSAVFEDIAQEAVDLCRKSLVAASNILMRKVKIDYAELFLIKNLLTLREQTVTFDATLIRREDHLDVGSVRDALMLLLDPKTFYSFGANIKVIESYSNARQAAAFKLGSSSITSSTPSGSLKDQIYAQPSHVLYAYDSFREAVSVRLVGSVQRLDEMLGDRRTESVIIRVIRNSTLESYRAFHSTVEAEYKGEPLLDGKILRPKEMEDFIVGLTRHIEVAGLTNTAVGDSSPR
ncbi:Golgi transport complex subunit 3 [Gonapodya sp. JEL0774]|nr:Golgi transport complex subunit 3 [Gonapodya sp. JEL0774]